MKPSVPSDRLAAVTWEATRPRLEIIPGAFTADGISTF